MGTKSGNMKILCTGAPRSGTSMLSLLMTYFKGINVYTHGTPEELWKHHDCFTTQQRPDGFIWNDFINKKSLREFADDNVKVVCIYRDGRDALISKRKNWVQDADGSVNAKLENNDYWYGPDIHHTKKWITSIDVVLDIIENPHDNIFLIKYEELVSNHSKVMPQLAEFLGLELNMGYTEFYKDYEGKYNLSTEGAIGAEHKGLRPLAPNSGNWKMIKHFKRMTEILNYIPEISDRLIKLDYEDDDKWTEKFGPITFVIPSRNNLELLKLAYKSIKRLENDHHILVLDDASEDGTGEWLNRYEIKSDKNLHVYTNPGPERVGIVGMFDKGIEIAPTKIIMAFHSDMVAGMALDTHILKHLERGKVVTATRIEPPLHPPGPEKIIVDCGVEPDNFNETLFYETVYNLQTNPDLRYGRETTNGIFAPWCMYKDDFLEIGGHDELFAPQSREDSDLFNRFLLNGYELIQTWEGFVYHFTSRGSRFNKYAGGDIGKDSPEWQQTNQKNMRNFIRKWKHSVLHDELMLPIVTPVYDIGFVVHNCSLENLANLEIWCDDIYGDWVGHKGFGVNKYIEEEQKKTTIDISKKIHSDHFNPKNDVIVEFDVTKLTDEDFQVIQNLGLILEDSGSVGEFKLGNLKFKISKLEQLQNKNIKSK